MPACHSSLLLIFLFTLVHLVTPIPSTWQPPPDAGDNECWNTPYYYDPTSWNETFVYEVPARMYVQKKWSPTESSELPVTICSHLTVSRVNQLEAQCSNWEGNLVAVVYMPLEQQIVGERTIETWLDEHGQNKVRNAMDQLHALHQRVEQRSSSCKLTMLLVWEAISQSNLTLLYPYNSLRNLAILQAKTPLVAMLDVDLVPSSSLAQELKDPVKRQQLQDLCAQKVAVVLPALELAPLSAEESSTSGGRLLPKMLEKFRVAVHGGKDKVRQMWGKEIIPFMNLSFVPAQAASNYPKWMESTDYYDIAYSWEYEPYFIIDRRLSMWYDVRFRAYFYDKVLQLATLVKMAGVRLVGHPNAFLIHRPHPKSSVRNDMSVFVRILNVMKPRAGMVWLSLWDNTHRIRIDHVLRGCLQSMQWWAVEFEDKSYKATYDIWTGGDPITPHV